MELESRQKVGTVEGATWIKQVIDVDKPARVFIDLGGVGAGTFDILQSWGAPYDKIVVGVNFGGEPQEPVRYLKDGTKEPGPRNRRAEMWARSKEWLNGPGGADIPDLDSLHADACGPGNSYEMNQRLQLDRREGVFQQCLRQCRIVREVGERDLRLDHPELGEVAAGIRVLGAERCSASFSAAKLGPKWQYAPAQSTTRECEPQRVAGGCWVGRGAWKAGSRRRPA
jgi:hypothetical protein